MRQLWWVASMLAAGLLACSSPAPTAAPSPAPTPMQDPPVTSASPFDGIQLTAGMPRAEAEQRIAKALGRGGSDYSPYGNNLRGGAIEYIDATGHHVLEVIYKPGAPAPWEMQPDGTAIHREPIDESIASFRTFTK